MSSENNCDNQTKSKRFYGRRHGRPMGKTRRFTVDELLPKVKIDQSLLHEQQSVSPAEIFGNDNPVWLEIGFGSGEHLHGLMKVHQQVNFLGCEPFVNGMSCFLKSLYGLEPDENEPDTDISKSLEHHNVKVIMDDAFFLVNSLQDDSVDRIYVLNPDPWPKKRHHKRRIINPSNLDKLGRILKRDGLLIMSTDVDELADWMFEQADNHEKFACEPSLRNKINRYEQPKGWIETRYEIKGREAKRQQSYLVFYKI